MCIYIQHTAHYQIQSLLSNASPSSHSYVVTSMATYWLMSLPPNKSITKHFSSKLHRHKTVLPQVSVSLYIIP